MAKYDVECPECGDSYAVQLYGNSRDREWKLDNWDWTCDECKERARQEENKKAAAANAEAGLPALTGDVDKGRLDLAIRHNRARGTHSIDLMVNIVAELVQAGMSDGWIAKHIGMDADELLRLKQISGLARLFANQEFSRAWELNGDMV